MEPIHLKTFLRNKTTNIGDKFLTSIKNLDTIKFDKSITLFHDINEVFLLFNKKKIQSMDNFDKQYVFNRTKKIYINPKSKKMTKKRT